MTNTCPVCGKPLLDTRYVCHGCGRHLAKALLRAAAELHELEVTLARQDAVDTQAGTSAAAPDPQTFAGPTCEKACEHESCWRNRESLGQLALWGLWCDGYCAHDGCRRALDMWGRKVLADHRTATGGDPLPNEGSVPYHAAASEALAIIANTIGIWARHVSDTRGTTIPAQAPPPRSYTEPVGSGARKGGDAAYCTCCDLPVEFCFTSQNRSTTMTHPFTPAEAEAARDVLREAGVPDADIEQGALAGALRLAIAGGLTPTDAAAKAAESLRMLGS